MDGGAEEGRPPFEVLGAAPIGMFLTDPGGRLIYANAFWTTLFGRPLEGCLGFGWVECVHPDDRERVMAEWSHAVNEERPFTSEYRFLRPDGETAWAVAQARTYADPNGGILGWVGVVTDITEKRDAQVARDRLSRQLHQAHRMETLGTLAGGVAHDFNNLLTAIRGGLQMALMGLEPAARAAPFLRAAEEATERAAELTRQMLTLGRNVEAERQPTDVNRTVDRTARLLRRSLASGIKVEVHLDADIPLIEADPTHLSQILLNLGMNARDAMPDGGRLRFSTSRVTVRDDAIKRHPDARAGRYVVLGVKDSGHGIDDSALDHIFEPFFTTKCADEGTGLGLAMVDSCAREHGGWVEVDTARDVGTEFRVMLPIVEARPQAAIPSSLPRGSETVLLVDDEELVLFQASAILERFGYRVLTARDARQALETVGAHRVALVITDLVMPDVGGRDLLRLLRADGLRMPVVLMSGYTDGARRSALRQEGFAEFLAKPFDATALTTTVRRVIDEGDPVGTEASAEL